MTTIENTTVQQQLKDAQTEAIAALETIADLKALEALHTKYLGRKDGLINNIKKQLKDVPPEERPQIGALANEISNTIETLIAEKEAGLKAQALESQLKSETLDVTMPGVYQPLGQLHPLTHVTQEICRIFQGMGFNVLDDNVCSEVETEHYNFEALNFPADHPARDMQDTFYTDVGPQVLLRSQTSNAQIRHMEKHKPPIRVVAPGRVYRNEEVSSRKNVLFHQLEGLLVDETVRLSDLKGVLNTFAAHFFNGERPSRFRGSYFPFTEPSVEMDIQCILCEGKGCRTCGHSGWLEILGAGMVDPNVLEMVGIDSEKYVGFAFGMGIERLAMLKYAFNNIRDFYTNDSRFLKAFHGS